jgi:DnaJ-class molecular chaperone
MEIVDYYYKILELPYDADIEQIYNAYNLKIEKYRNLPFLNNTQKSEIKELKKAKFILSNEEYRKIYDASIDKKNTEVKKMKDWEKKTYAKKDKVDSQLLSNRIFDMSGIINVPQKNLNMDRQFFASSGDGDNLAPFE